MNAGLYAASLVTGVPPSRIGTAELERAVGVLIRMLEVPAAYPAVAEVAQYIASLRKNLRLEEERMRCGERQAARI